MDDKIPLGIIEKKDTNNNNNKNESDLKENINNNEDKKPFFLMTLEDNMGKCQQIKIYQNSNPSELAYYFCKENNLDFTSMKYIKSNIKSIVKKFNEPQQKTLLYNNSNNSIKEEEDEDDYLTEGTVRSNEKQKENDEENYSNENNLKNDISKDNNDKSNKDIINNDIQKNNQNENNNDKNNENNNDKNNDNNNDNKNDNNNNNSNTNNNELDNIKNINEKSTKLDEKNELKKDNIDIYSKKSKGISSNEKENKSFEIINSHLKSINNLGKIPLKINQISPKQIEINENIHKIINNSNKSDYIMSDIENINNNNLENNKDNCNINGTDRSRNKGFMSNIDKEIKDISNSLKSKEKIKLSDKKKNNATNSSYKFPQKNDKLIDNIKEEYDKEINNRNQDNNNYNNFDLNYFGQKYINLNKNINEDKNNSQEKEEISKSIAQSSESFENGVPVLNNENNNDNDNKNKFEVNRTEIPLKKNESIINIEKNDDIKLTFPQCNNDNNNIKNLGNKNNKDIILNKTKKIESNISKKKNKKNNEINKLLNLIKNSCYNINKNIRNKIIKEKKNNTNIFTLDRLKMKESNSLDINYEISRNLDNEANKNFPKEANNNINNTKNENKYKINNYKNTNFKTYIGNNKFNYKNNNNISNSNNESNQNVSNPISRKYFFSNPNLSSNQEAVNLSNAIYNVKHNLKNNKKSELSNKSKSLGKENKKVNSTSKNRIKLSKKYNVNINNRHKLKELIKEKTKKYSLKFKNKYNINVNSSTPNNAEHKKHNKYLNIKSCQTPPSKKASNTYHYINTVFSEWLMSTINRDSRNVFTARDHYFRRNKSINKTSKSVSELVDNNNAKKSNYKMQLSKSNFKNTKQNTIVKSIKYNMRNRASKDVNNRNNNMKNSHHYVNSLKIINKSNNLYHKNIFNKKNNNDNKIITNKKFAGRNKAIIRKQLEKLKYINPNTNTSNINTINDYNFNNNNSYIRKFINNTINTFMYDSSENSKSEDKFKKIIQKQLTSPSKTKYFENKTKKKSSDKIMAYKNGMNKYGKILLNNSGSTQSYTNENGPNNININNLININNYQKNKNYNFNYNNNGNNHYIKNSRLKKNKISNKLNKNLNYNENNKRLVNFSNELSNYYLNTEIYKNNYNNLTYSNFIKNSISLSNYDLSTEGKITDDILVNFFNKIFMLLNKDNSDKFITLESSYYKKRINLFPIKIRQILNTMIEILYNNYGKRKKNNLSNNSLVYTAKINNDIEFKIDKNTFINEMVYIFKYYLCSENKKLLISYKDNFNINIHDNIINRNFGSINKNDLISPKSYQKKSQFKTKTECKNNGKIKSE